MKSVAKKNEAVDCKRNDSRFCLNNYNISFQMWKSWRLSTEKSARLRPRRRHDELKICLRRPCCPPVSMLGNGKLGLLFVFILILCSFSIVNASSVSKCRNRKRIVLNETFGVITDGLAQEYKEFDYCEWLVKAPDPKSYIVLQFSHFETECSYDFLFAYDGASYTSPLLASFSGDTLPVPIVARSGMMLIYFYSDRNYVLDGFYASFIVEDCLFNCSGNGVCIDHSCICNDLYTGEACQYEVCPNECGADQGHGMCQLNNNGTSHCECYNGYIGQDCSLSTNDNSGWGSTFTIFNGNGPSRTAHGGVYHSKTNAFWIFGGFDLNNVLDDILMYNFTSNEWLEVQPQSAIRPVGRRSHTVVLYQNELIVFGGVLSNGSYTNELWSFDISTLKWQLLSTGSRVVPVARADHSASIVEYSALYIFGGHSKNENFLGTLYKYDLVLRIGWTFIQPLGGLEFDVHVTGHSSVYHYDSKSLVIFGGFRPKWLKVTARTNETYAFHIDKLYWMEWENRIKRAPTERAFHTAVIMGNYMVVYGGNVHVQMREKKRKQAYYTEKCYDDEVSFYHLGCHRWLTDEEISQDFRSAIETIPQPKGRFGHIAAVRDDNILLIAGGYSGTVLNDIFAIKVPGSVATNSANYHPDECRTFCHMHTRSSSCTLDPDCGWCSHTEVDNTPACLPHTQQQMCAGKFELSDCPGICDVLTTCESCTIWGQGTGPTTYAPTGVRLNEKCGWCVQDGMCTRINELSGFCHTTNSTLPVGWWGRNGDFLQEFEQCRTDDFPPGLILIKYAEPVNKMQPDEVEIIRTSYFQYTSKNFEFNAIMKGFIYPNEAKPPPGSQLRVWLGQDEGNTSLIISNDPKQNKSLNIQTTDGEAKRDNNEDIFPKVKRGVKYYLKLESKQITRHHLLELSWNGNLENAKDTCTTLSAEYIQPYFTSDCTQYTNCKACLTDASCGWCPTSFTCELRNGPMVSSDRCGKSAVPGHHLIVDLMMCVDCFYHISCQSCTRDGLCEWRASESMCFRRGLKTDTITTPDKCSDPCLMATTCSSCSSNPDCGWCEETNHCFVYGTYTLLFPFGQCSHWHEESSMCVDCSSFTDCNTCLSHFQCGWCTDPNDLTMGRCMEGDFDGPFNSECSYLIDPINNITSPAIWDYQECYSCERNQDNCSENATCVETEDYLGFTCHCNEGFEGDGMTCKRTCIGGCVHGKCLESVGYKCVCDIGWTGETCDVDCQCNGHSTCINGVGLCDQCRYNTTGTTCDSCIPGFYKHPTTGSCRKCDCNGHDDPAKGHCDPITGHCYCKDQTNGTKCERCADGLHGDPSNGGSCYILCRGRTLLTNISSGSIMAENVNYCLMVLSVFKSIQEMTQPIAAPSITFTIQKDIYIDCGFEFVTVYDGIPLNVSGNTMTNSKVLGRFCGKHLERPLTVTASLGTLTLHYESRKAVDQPTYGFKAVFQVNSCPKSCYGNRKCVKAKCVCKKGYYGQLCQTKICPNNCSKHGTCDKNLGLCICEEGFGGVSCNERVNDNNVVWTAIFDPERLQNSGLCGYYYPCGRSGHIMLHAGEGNLLIFGGFSMQQGFLNDIWSFNTSSREWRKEQLQSSAIKAPPPRGHTAACFYNNEVIVFGGEDYSKVFNDLWIFDMETKRWRKMENYVSPPAVAGHTLTRIGESSASSYLLLIGGYSPENGFLHGTWKYLLAAHSWHKIFTKGISPTGIYGHSAVYDTSTQAVYVFGGYTFCVNRTQISDLLYVFHIPTKHWSILPNEDTRSSHLFHSAVSIQNNMIVLGGFNEDMDFTSSILAYRYMCNQWIDLAGYSVGDSPFINKDQAVVAIGNRIYVYGGQAGISFSTIHALDLPNDLCSLETTKDGCYKRPGCSVCVDSRNRIYCYNSQSASEPDSCQSGEDSFGRDVCDQKRQQDRNCSLATSCAECVPKYPAFPNANQTCKWCSYCPKGTCISVHDECEDNLCRVERPIVTDGNCPASVCAASTCGQCHDLGCIWTNHVLQLSETRTYMSVVSTYKWNCYHQHDFKNAPEEIQKEITYSKFSSTCPVPCLEHTSCQLCLQSSGLESGWDSCVWSTELNLCMSPTYIHLHCINGLCGTFIDTDMSLNCPPSSNDHCSGKTRCSHCLQESGCGWCAKPGTNGEGVCLKGAFYGSENRQCFRASTNKDTTVSPDGDWHYFKCPPENECLNGRHACFSCETCEDTLEHYICKCQSGFSCNRSTECTPECDPPCKEGNGVCQTVSCTTTDCEKKNQCKCNFGFFGDDCRYECDCNGHSDCLESGKNCFACIHNTRGSRCEQCLPGFVGNPINGGECTSCSDFCNSNSNSCALKDNNVVCWNCTNNTEGTKCEECKFGYFKQAGVCVKCMCNGNCDTCDSKTGFVANCKNNTMTDKEIPEREQCGKCIDKFVGSPSQRRPCYRSLILDHSFCLTEPPTGETAVPRCDSFLVDLDQGRPLFYHIEKKTDVDLLSDIQVSRGKFDVFIASNEFLLRSVVDHKSGFSTVQVNNTVRITSYGVTTKWRRSTKVVHLDTGDYTTKIYHNTSLVDIKRDVSNKIPYKSEDVFRYYETKADGVNNFMYITFSRFVIKITDVQDRLVLHFQQIRRTTPHYYIALLSKGNTTKALVKLARKTKAQIDLFVFFSVFFSSFFILLSLCVVLWKIKLWRDSHLRFRRQTLEMENRRSRPFGNVLVMVDQKRTRPRKSRGHRNRGESHQVPAHPTKQPPSFITIEPTFDDLATVCTVLFTLPGGDAAPTRGCLGSALFSYRPPPPKIQDNRQKNADEIKPRLATYYSRMRQGAVTRGRNPTQPHPPPPEWL